MITRRYLLSTTSSRSSMGGLVMPSAVVLPATGFLPSLRTERRVIAPRARHALSRHQGYQLPAHVLDGCVHQRDIELAAGFDLLPRHFQAAGDHVGRFGAAAGEPAGQFLTRWRGQEDQQGAGHAAAHLPCALDVNLQKSRSPRGGLRRDGSLRGAVLLAVKRCPLKQLAAGHHGIEYRVVHKMVFTTVDFARPRRAGSHRNRQPDVRALRPQARYDSALANAGRAGKYRQPGFMGAPTDKRGVAYAMKRRISRGTVFPALILGVVRVGQSSPPNSFSSAVR